ncbi:macro domain protein [Bacillus phage vB_BceM-HSE3]|nr:macro domain protein [Bacillus phage vB_BceM-HSE3]
MSVVVLKGDLLKSDCNVIAHQCNCQSTMGSGIAKQIRDRYPQVYDVDRLSPMKPREKLGKLTHIAVPEACAIGYSRQVYNLYGQFNYGMRGKVHTSYDALYSSLVMMFNMVSQYPRGSVKVGLPYGMGCVRGGGDWNRVTRLLEDISAQYAIDINLYKL